MLRVGAMAVPIRIDEDGVAWVGRTDVPIERVIFAFNRGDSPQAIVEQYPVLTLADVYGVIAYYLQSQAGRLVGAYRTHDGLFDALGEYASDRGTLITSLF